MTYYSVGQNIPGYLPMADEPWFTDDLNSAKSELIDMMNGMVEMFCDALNGTLIEGQADISAAEAADIESAITEYEVEMGQVENMDLDSYGYNVTLPRDPLSRHDLGLHFFIDVIEGDMPEEDV